MERKRKAVFLLAALLFSIQAVSVSGDELKRHPGNSVVSLGADLTDVEKSIVLGHFGLGDGDLAAYPVVFVTNQEEHQYLGDYLDKGIIGERALSSAIMTVRQEGHGIHVVTQNISYCTAGMYQNALATAGIKDVDVIVTGPFSISGTAALIGMIKSYEGLTGQVMDRDQIDAANRELAVSSELGKALDDSAQAEQLISMIKDRVIANNYSMEEMSRVIGQTADKMQISLTEEERQEILDLMDQIHGLDLDIDAIKQQASTIYEQLQSVNLNVKTDQTKGFLSRLWEKLKAFYTAL